MPSSDSVGAGGATFEANSQKSAVIVRRSKRDETRMDVLHARRCPKIARSEIGFFLRMGEAALLWALLAHRQSVEITLRMGPKGAHHQSEL